MTDEREHFRLHKINHALRRKAAKAELRTAVRDDYAAGLTIPEVAAKQGVSWGHVHKLLHEPT
jgi:hypothetical protein